MPARLLARLDRRSLREQRSRCRARLVAIDADKPLPSRAMTQLLELLRTYRCLEMRSHREAERIRRVGMLLPPAADDSESQRRVTSFVQELQELGWIEGLNRAPYHKGM